MARTAPSLTILQDFGDVSALDSQVRLSLEAWSKQHPRALASIHALSQSKIVNMSMTALSLAIPGLKVQCYTKRREFDALCGKLGLPIHVRMPTIPGI